MRKLIGLLLAVGLVFVFSAPAPAADDKTLDQRVKALEDTIGAWSFYGSARLATFYEASNKNEFIDADEATSLTGPDQKTTQWALSGVSRFGAKVNKGALGGRVEFGVGSGVSSRLLYGTYTSGDVTFLFGKDWAPLNDWSDSNQVFNGDNDMAGWGIMDVNGTRLPQIKVLYKGLQVALLANPGADTCRLDSADTNIENILPRLEVRYGIAADKFNADIFGGVHSYKVKFDDTTTSFNKTVSSYALGLNGGVTVNPIFANAQVWMAQNGNQLGLHQANALGAFIDPATGELTKDKDMGFALVAGMNIEKITVEVGYGYVQSKLDTSGAKKDDAQNYYIQAVIPVAATNGAKFSVTPEIGVLDYKKGYFLDSNDNVVYGKQGKATYAGAKCQIDF